MGIEIELVEGVRGDLATVFQILLNNPDEETPPTLGQAKKAIKNGLLRQLSADDDIIMDKRELLTMEISALIDEYGNEAMIETFIKTTSSDQLALLIEAVIDQSDPNTPALLGDVRDGIHNGILAQLMAGGEIESDVEENLIIEVNELIEAHGSDALAEGFIC